MTKTGPFIFGLWLYPKPPMVLSYVHIHRQAQEGSCYCDRGEETEQYTQSKRQRKASDDARAKCHTEPKEDATRDQRRNVRIANRRPSTLESEFYRKIQRAAIAQFFFHTLKDQNIGVDGHAHG